MLRSELEEKETLSKKKINTCEYITRKGIDLLSWLSAPNKPRSQLQPQRFADAIFLSADPHFGQILKVCHASGKGLGDIIIKEAREKLMQAENKKDYSAKGRCTLYFGPEIMQDKAQFVIIVKDPEDIKKILKVNTENNHDSAGNFSRVLGNPVIFEMKAGSPEYIAEKKRFKSLLFDDDALTKDLINMQTYTKDFFNEIKKTVSVQEFAKNYTIGIIAKTKLGIEKIPAEVKKEVSDKINAGSRQLGNIQHNLLLAAMPFLSKRPFSYLMDRPLKKIVKDGDVLIREKILKPNKENILQSNNWITLDKKDTERKSIDLESDEVLRRFKQLFIVGHDTTANILEFALKFLADHPEIYAEVRKETDTETGDPLKWRTVKDSRLPMLTAVILETLRLQPSVAMMFNKMKVDCKLREDDNESLKKGDIVFFSQYLTHRCKKIWGEDADQFNPKRFLDKDNKIKFFPPYQFFPFGFNPRLCLGQNMAKLEIAMCLAYVVKNFDLKLHRDKDHDPYEVNIIFTLKSVDKECQLEFIPREYRPTYIFK